MVTRSHRVNVLLSALFIIASGCGSGGLGCGGCNTAPLPGGALPADQTIEGGGQIRITADGFDKVSTLVESLVVDSFSDGLCVPPIGFGDSTLGVFVCNTNQGSCTPGCNVAISDVQADAQPAGSELNVAVSVDLNSTLPVRGSILGGGFNICSMSLSANDLAIDVDIAFGIDPADGELTIELAGINTVDFNLDASGCVLGDVLGAAFDLIDIVFDVASDINDLFGGLVFDLITPTINDLIQSVLPDPLGIEGMTDLGGLLAGISPGTTGQLETRLVPGGYVSLNNAGMSLGLITGINADEDISTRTPELDNEPAYCVPPFAAPDFAAAPHSLPRQALRQTFQLAAAGAFNGAPDPATDLAMGISETTLDQLGHHAVTSGAMCLGIGTTTVAQLNLGTFGLLVPSAVELASEQGNDPMLLVTRPQRPIDFTIGAGTEASPSLTAHLRDFEVDFYAFLYERYTRLFTLSLTLNAGVNLEVMQLPGQPAQLQPSLVGLTADDIELSVLNAEFVRETPADLEAILPAVFDLVLPLLADGLPAIDVPEFAGFRLDDLSIERVSTAQDDFLAIYASLGPSSTMAALAAKRPGRLRDFVDSLSHGNRGRDATVAGPAPTTPRARLHGVDTPAPAAIRAGLIAAAAGGAAVLPTISVDVDAVDELGRPLEWSWRMAGGLWRPYAAPTDGVLAISDRAFAWQGKYDLELRPRVIAAPVSTVGGASLVHAIVDSAAPTVLVEQARVTDTIFEVEARDVVSAPEALRFAFGRPDADAPATAWQATGTIGRDVIDDLAVDGLVAVYVRDEAGNEAVALANTAFHGQADAAGCSGCQSSGDASGALVLIGLVGLVLVGGPRRRRALALVRRHAGSLAIWLGATVATSLVPGCDCGNTPGAGYCEEVEDCAGLCDADQIAFCIDNTCICDDDLPAGRIGPYSEVGTNDNGVTWVSAYAESYGDLVVARVDGEGRIVPTAWEWVDGVPDVAPAIEGSMIRGGIDEDGEDVGMYTSIAVTAAGDPRVSYFARDAGSLKFAAKVGDAWQTHVVVDGGGSVKGSEVTGVYTSISLRTDDGRPGIAFAKYVTEGAESRAEVWFAQARVALPTASSDWTTYLVDTATFPTPSDDAPDLFPLPGGIGLFLDVARGPDQAPVIVYYDRTAGDLRLARFDALADAFLAPEVIAGATSDAGWSPSVVVGADGVIHVAYVAATNDDLTYWSSAAGLEEIVDDGYRIVGTTADGLPKPEFHLVGDDATIVLIDGAPAIVYQDATTHELLEARRSATGQWTRALVAGGEAEFVGGYGFFASASLSVSELVISSWVIDLPAQDEWVEVFRRRLSVD
ncbi:MAG: hypothetical protein R2939_01855 [Kofleriaceae bacterium]